MRSKTITAFALLVCAFSAIAQSGVKVKEEPAKETEVRTKSVDATKTPKLQLVAIKEEVAADPSDDSIGLIFISKSEKQQYEKCFTLVALADGKPVDVGKSDHEAEAGQGFVMEYVTASINLKTLNVFAKAGEVKFKICNDSVVLTSEEMAQVREFTQAVTPAEVPAAKPAAAPAAAPAPAPATVTPAPPASPAAPAPKASAPAAPAPAPESKPATAGGK